MPPQGSLQQRGPRRGLAWAWLGPLQSLSSSPPGAAWPAGARWSARADASYGHRGLAGGVWLGPAAPQLGSGRPYLGAPSCQNISPGSRPPRSSSRTDGCLTAPRLRAATPWPTRSTTPRGPPRPAHGGAADLQPGEPPPGPLERDKPKQSLIKNENSSNASGAARLSTLPPTGRRLLVGPRAVALLLAERRLVAFLAAPSGAWRCGASRRGPPRGPRWPQ